MTSVSSPLLVGRMAELEHLERALLRAQARQPSVVLVAGEAGMGKTRLLREVVETTGCPPSRLLLGGCMPLGSGVPYAPVAEDPRALVRALGADQVRWLAGPGSAELAVLVPELAPAEAPPETAEAEAGTAQVRPFEAFLALLGRLSEDGLALFLVEDLHWADRATLDLVAFVVRNLRQEAVAVVLTYRDDELHKAHPLRAWIGELRRLDSHRREAQQGIDVLRQAVDLAWTATDGDALARSYINLGHVLGLAGRLEEAVQASVEG